MLFFSLLKFWDVSDFRVVFQFISLFLNNFTFLVDIDLLLQKFQCSRVHLDLSRVESLLLGLGNPQNQLPIIHVAGTNGKGSVCAYLSSILRKAGYRTGRYTSPHLVNWIERISVNDQPIFPSELYKILQKVENAIAPNQDLPTQFEVITIAAWLYFVYRQVDIAVFEVGLGGRLDATNVCPPPLVSVITSISREHCQILGDTLAEIAAEKAGIIKTGRPVVMGVLPLNAQQVIRSQASKLKSPLIVTKSSRQLKPGWAKYKCSNGKYIKYPLPLSGQFQLTNSAVAIATIEVLQKQGWNIPESAIINGIAQTQWLGRIQWTTWKRQKLLIDGAHNPDSAKALRDYIDSLSATYVVWIIGMLSNKDHFNIFRELLRTQDRLYLVPIPEHNSANPRELAQLATTICPGLESCYPHTDLLSVLDIAFNPSNNDGLVILCGSLYLVGYFLSLQSS
ncbi:Dihydrofolate synthase [Richelia intracellularis HM01]|uniref:bifunctional folylpolyglutamate synthase/dihydrofolate synthase n=1 Tax=Richelia intracellularis TaxID=1164990 RepID=UPI0002B55600|nr:folylpolyglutamate synthase/dihydrofolate synthase family protein [Richelia intracellularis]CCH64823.1 Dihydrofolate synthase [Richelia intracellularis HM01]